MRDFCGWKNGLREEVLRRIDYSKELSDGEVRDIIDEVMLEESELQLCPMDVRGQLRRELFDSLRRLDVLQLFVEDPSITEIMINGHESLFVEREGQLYKLNAAFESSEQLERVIQQIVSGCNRTVNEASPIVDARLPGGARVNVVMRPVALDGPAVTVRRFPEKAITAEELIDRGSLTEEAADFLKQLVKAKYNIFISGGTGSGKTTFLNVLSGFIPSDERVITIEDNAELQLQNSPNLVRLEARRGNAEGCAEIGIRELIRTSLRMRPDRIIVGEVRGPEAFDMVQAMNTGHEGSMSTGHANSAADSLFRLENMVLMGMDMPLAALRQQLVSAVDIVVHLGRLRDYSRHVMEISEVIGVDASGYCLQTLYRFSEREKGQGSAGLRKVGELTHDRKLKMAEVCKGEGE